MYGYKEYTPLTPDEILKRISQEDIFGMVIKEPIIEDKGAFYKAPYRNDSVGDCYFVRIDGILYFVDFADIGKKSKNWINFLKRVYNCDYKDALERVNSNFSLGLGDDIEKTKEVVLENDFVEGEKTLKSFKERIITYLPRQFGYKDRQFWEKYGITRQNLIDDKVIPIELYQSTSRKDIGFTIRCFDLCYAYTDFPGGKVKIYRPFGDKLSKWFTNCNQNDLGSVSHLPPTGRLLVITKAYKDCRVVRNEGVPSVWTQNEGQFPNEQIIKDLCDRFTEIVVWFDNDGAGIANSRFLVEYINSIVPNKARSIMLPPRLLRDNIKDPSDYRAAKGREELREFMKQKRLIL